MIYIKTFNIRYGPALKLQKNCVNRSCFIPRTTYLNLPVDLFLLILFLNLQKQPQEVFCKNVFLNISQNSQESTSARVSFLIRILWYRCFPVNFVKFLRTSFLQNTSGRLFLNLIEILRFYRTIFQ